MPRWTITSGVSGPGPSTPATGPTPPRGPGPSRSTRPPASSSRTPPTPPICSPCRSTGTSTPGSPTRPWPPSKSGWPAWKAGSGRWPRPAGRRAELLVFTALAGAGDHIVASAALYGGTHTLLDVSLRRLGIETTFVAPDDPAAFAAAARPETKAFYTEIVANPSGVVADLAALAEAAHRPASRWSWTRRWPPRTCAAPSSTAPTWSCTRRPSSSAATAPRMGGVVVESGRFDWANGRFPRMTEPVASYGGLRFWDNFGEYGFCTQLRVEQLRDFGTCPGPAQRLPPPAGTRDPVAADGRPRGQRPRAGRAPVRPSGGGLGLLRRA